MKDLKKFYLKTFGCQLNFADSERIVGAFEKKGHKQTNDINEANTIIINSCIVRQSAENRAYGLINNLKSKILNIKCKNTKPKVLLTGCLAGWAINDKTGKNLAILKERIGGKIKITATEKLTGQKTAPKRQGEIASVPISNGCNHFCSYCIVPYARGKEVYYSSEIILKEACSAVKNGFFKIMLLGQNVNTWKGKGKIKDFPDLVDAVAKIPGVKKIYIMSPNPWDFSGKLITVIAKNANISHKIHLPLQSGSDKILKKMNRPYTAKNYLALIKDLKSKIPNTKISTDILVGFPGETKADFQKTVDLCKKVGFEKAYVNKYSPRPGTLSAKLYPDDVPAGEKKRRWRIIDKLTNNYQ